MKYCPHCGRKVKDEWFEVTCHRCGKTRSARKLCELYSTGWLRGRLEGTDSWWTWACRDCRRPEETASSQFKREDKLRKMTLVGAVKLKLAIIRHVAVEILRHPLRNGEVHVVWRGRAWTVTHSEKESVNSEAPAGDLRKLQ